MKVENFFLRYAYPCAYIIMQRGELSKQELDELEDIAIHNKPISRQRLENIFFRAFEHIERLAKLRNKSRWSPEVIQEYFYSYHNLVIDNGEGSYATTPPTLKELSKVDTAEVTYKTDNVLTVQFNGKIRNVVDSFVPEARVGDRVRIHYGFAVELV